MISICPGTIANLSLSLSGFIDFLAILSPLKCASFIQNFGLLYRPQSSPRSNWRANEYNLAFEFASLSAALSTVSFAELSAKHWLFRISLIYSWFYFYRDHHYPIVACTINFFLFYILNASTTWSFPLSFQQSRAIHSLHLIKKNSTVQFQTAAHWWLAWRTRTQWKWSPEDPLW